MLTHFEHNGRSISNMYDNIVATYSESLKTAIGEKPPSKPPPKPPPSPPGKPATAPGKKFTEAAPTPIRKSTDPKPPSFPRK